MSMKLECRNDVDHSARVHVEAHRMQQPVEMQKIVDQIGHQTFIAGAEAPALRVARTL